MPLKIMRGGLRYDDLSEEEKDHRGSLKWGEGEQPDTVEAAEISQRLFNEDTVDRVIAHFTRLPCIKAFSGLTSHRPRATDAAHSGTRETSGAGFLWPSPEMSFGPRSWA